MAKTRYRLSELVALPAVGAFEAPTSWLTRAALSQGVKPEEFLGFLGFEPKEIRTEDLDLLLASSRGQDVLVYRDGRAMLPVATRIYNSLTQFDAEGRFLLRGDKNCARYRFCPLCLQQQRVPHLELHWRFAPWKMCPLHHCLMEDRCSFCRSLVLLPFDMTRAGREKREIAQLSDCRNCGRSLHSVKPVFLSSLGLTELEAMRLGNGRALLSALWHQRVFIDDDPKPSALRYCRTLFMIGTFWTPDAWVSADEVRQLAGDAAAQVGWADVPALN